MIKYRKVTKALQVFLQRIFYFLVKKLIDRSKE